MNVLSTTIKDRSSTSEAAEITIQEFDRAYEVQKDDFERGQKAWKRYFPINYGKWDEEALKVMQEEYRQPIQLDIASPRVDTLAGSLVSDLPDPTWVPVRGQKGVLTEAIAEKYYSDKEEYNYDDIFLKVFRDGLIHCGDLAITEDYKYHVPQIKFERIMFGFLVWDPYWITDDDRDAEVAYRIAWMNADRIVRKYRHATDELMREIKEYKKDKSGYPINIEEQQRRKLLGRVGDEFQIIEKHFIEHIKTSRLIGRREGETSWIPFPINKERAYLERFAEINRIDWTTVIEDSYDDKISYVTTVCRELKNAQIQEHVKNKVQVNGLPFHHFTARRCYGKNMGAIESIADVEDTINKRESLVTELISKAGGGGSLVNEELFPDPKKRQEAVKMKNKPGHWQFAPLDNVKRIMEQVAPAQFSPAISDQVNRMYDKALPIVSRVSDTLSSMSESGEPALLFERKFQVNMIANTLMNRNMRQFINNTAESYFYQWQITYGDQEIDVVFRDGKTKITLNQHRGNFIVNDVRSIPRCRVVIAENTKSQLYQMRWRSIYSEMLERLNPQVVPAHYMLAVKNFFESIETNDEDKVQLKVINDMMMMIARLDLVAKATTSQVTSQGNTLQSVQIDMQLQQIMQQLQLQQAQAQPMGHIEQQQEQISYPEETPVITPEENKMNPPTIEEASGGMPTKPAMTEAYR
jgi:hypothetical protein